MKVYLTSLGCRLNEAELQSWSNDFSKIGINVTDDLLAANLMVINTCAVTGEAARKSRQSIRRLHRKNPNAKLVVTGCYASLEKSQAETLLGVDLIVSNQEKESLAEKSRELLDWSSMPFAATEPEESALFVRNRERAFIKVQDGCRYRCTYCIVTIARGEERSRTIDDILREIDQLVITGIKEIVITGVHVGGYGSDIETDLYQLVQSILQKTSILRIRFASVEPWDLHDDFFDLFSNSRLMPHMHLPIQSGSDRILKKMSRRCKSANFLQLLAKARSVNPDFNITSDIIVGFPGECDAEFQQSVSMVEQANFGHVHTFSYSKREGTKAASLAEQVDESIKKTRSKLIHQSAAAVKKKVLDKMLGKTVSVLWEGNGKRQNDLMTRFWGYTPNFHKVCVDVSHDQLLSNQLIDCRLQSVTDDLCLFGVLVADETRVITKIAVKQID